MRFLSAALGWWLLRVTWGEVHGGTLLALKGRDSVLLAADSRFTSYRTGSFLLGEFPRLVFCVGSRTLVGCIGLDSDIQSVLEACRERLSSHEDAWVEPQTVARVVSNILYRTRLYVSPMVVGIDSRTGPYICSLDGLGAQTEPEGFAVSGTANSGLYAICESLYEPGLDDEALVAVAERCLTQALQRDVLSGCSVTISLLKADGSVIKKILKTNDV